MVGARSPLGRVCHLFAAVRAGLVSSEDRSEEEVTDEALRRPIRAELLRVRSACEAVKLLSSLLGAHLAGYAHEARASKSDTVTAPPTDAAAHAALRFARFDL